VAFVTTKGTWLRYRIAGELMAANRRNGATCAGGNRGGQGAKARPAR
jgi:hypothetical protein